MIPMEPYDPASLCRQLLEPPPSAEREVLLEAAAMGPECLELLLGEGRQAVQTAPERTLVATELAVDLARRRQEGLIEAAVWRVRAQALRILGRHQDAISAFEAAAAAARAANDFKLAAQVQIGRVDSLGWLGRYEEAIAIAQRLTTELRAHDAAEDAAKVLVNLGSVHFRRDRYQAALDCYQEATLVLESCGDQIAVARVQTNSANILTQLNRVEEAMTLYRVAREVFVACGMTSVVAMIDANVGFLHYLSGEHSAALAALTRAQQEFAARDQGLERAKCDADMADVYVALNLNPEALDCYERAIGVFVQVPLDYERGKAELGRARVLMGQRQWDAAEEALAEAERIFTTHKNVVQLAHARLLQAMLLREEGDTRQASAEADVAARAFTRCKLPAWAAEARFLSLDIALAAGEDVVRRMHAVTRAARRYARGWLECRANQSIGLFYARQGKTALALRFLRAAVDTLETVRTLVAPEELHVAFLRDKLGVYESLIETLLTRGRSADITEAFVCVERAKSRLLLERVQTALGGRLGGDEGADTEIRTRLAALRAELSRSYHRLSASDQDAQRRFAVADAADLEKIVPLEHSYRALLREVELTQQPDVLTLASVLPTRELQAYLEPGEALIEYAVVRDEVCAFVLTPQGLRIRRDLATLDEVREMGRRLRYHLQKANIDRDYVACHGQQLLAGIQDVLTRLHQSLIDPLLDLLPADTQRFIVVPHGNLHGLPFHAFYDGTGYALDRWEFTYAPSAAVWHAGAKRRQEHSRKSLPLALLMGVPDRGIERVQAEVEQLATLLPDAELYCGESATLETFRRKASQCGLIHLATHAMFRADNPLFSGLRFADGWLLARDLYDMRLDCDLATLSACRTGVSDVEAGDELFGLTRGFLAAGARALAVSLWPADDAATAELMSCFYIALGQGKPRAAALREAQCATRTRYPHPYHWAAFVLIGER